MRAGSEAVDLAAIAVPADKNLRAAATTHKQSARHFIGALRHINPQPSAVSSSLQPRADRACRRARASQGQALRVAAKTRPALTGPARDGCAIWRSGRKNARGAGRTKEWNLRTQYPNRYSTSPHPTGVAMFGIIPDRRSHPPRAIPIFQFFADFETTGTNFLIPSVAQDYPELAGACPGVPGVDSHRNLARPLRCDSKSRAAHAQVSLVVVIAM